jgi:hypothetical protein
MQIPYRNNLREEILEDIDILYVFEGKRIERAGNSLGLGHELQSC